MPRDRRPHCVEEGRPSDRARREQLDHVAPGAVRVENFGDRSAAGHIWNVAQVAGACDFGREARSEDEVDTEIDDVGRCAAVDDRACADDELRQVPTAMTNQVGQDFGGSVTTGS